MWKRWAHRGTGGMGWGGGHTGEQGPRGGEGDTQGNRKHGVIKGGAHRGTGGMGWGHRGAWRAGAGADDSLFSVWFFRRLSSRKSRTTRIYGRTSSTIHSTNPVDSPSPPSPQFEIDQRVNEGFPLCSQSSSLAFSRISVLTWTPSS